MNGGKQRCQFARLIFQCSQPAGRQQAALLREFEPKERFIRFFQNSPDRIYPIGFAAGTASGTIARCYRCGGAQDLIRDNFSFRAPRQRIGHSHYPQGKPLCSRLKFFPIHHLNATTLRDIP